MKYTHLIFLALWTTSGLTAQVNFTSSHLPILVLNTNGQPIPDEPKLNVQAGLIDNGPGQTNHLSDAYNAFNGTVGIELRGSSSFYYPKSPYSIEFRTTTGDDLDVEILGLPAESDFALISPYNDKTLIRDILAHTFASQALPWSPKTRLIELVLNNQYMGVYTLIETIKRGPNRINIAKLKSDDLTSPDVTGGYILRMDKYGPPPGGLGGDWQSTYPPVDGGWQQTWFQYHYPKVEDIQPEQSNYIRNHIQSFENMLKSPSYQTQIEDWIDLDSWVNYLLVQELSKNTDAYRLSAYFYKNREDAPNGGKITMGPVWDFNISFGIGDYCNSMSWSGWAKDFNQVCGNDQWLIHFWWKKAWEYPHFRQKMAERWQELRSGPWSDANLEYTIDSLVQVIGPAQVRNFQRWPIIGTYVWPNSFIGSSYQQEIQFLKNWLLARAHWLDTNIIVAAMTVDPSLKPSAFAIFPNPASDRIFVQRNSSLPGGGICHFSLHSKDGKFLFEQRNILAQELFFIDLPQKESIKGWQAYTFTDIKGNVLDVGWILIQ